MLVIGRAAIVRIGDVQPFGVEKADLGTAHGRGQGHQVADVLGVHADDKIKIVKIAGADLPGALMTVAGDDLWPSQTREFVLKADKVLSLHIFITVPADRVAPGAAAFRISALDLAGSEQAHYGATFYAPED